LEPLLEWLGPIVATQYLDNAGSAEYLQELAHSEPDVHLERAFAWTTTEEGHDYWSNLNKEWLAHLEASAPGPQDVTSDEFELAVLRAVFGDNVKITKVK
jgi:hypothetical protein